MAREMTPTPTPGDDRSPFAAQAQWLMIAQTRLHLAARPQHLDAFIAAVRDAQPRLISRTLEEIRREIPRYVEFEASQRRELIATAASAATDHFLAVVQGARTPDRGVAELVQQVGSGERLDGLTLEPLRAALAIATRHCWRAIHVNAAKQGFSTEYLGGVGDALFAYVQYLQEELGQGYQRAAAQRDRKLLETAQPLLRARLIKTFLAEVPSSSERHAKLAIDAACANWQLPPEVVVMRLSCPDAFPTVPELPDVLLDATESPALVIASADDADSTLSAVLQAAPGIHIATAGPIRPEEVAQADRWARRTLQLVGLGAIPPQRVVRAEDHQLRLWLHAEPDLRRLLVQDLLGPLLAEPPASRALLSESMLLWLETRSSAPTIAALLDVHPQTVRYRWKRINELFGDRLQDPEFIVMITLVLEATVPLWRAGDTSDFEAFDLAQQA